MAPRLCPYPYLAIGMLPLVASAVLAAGGLYHVFRGAAVLKDGSGLVAFFHYDWDDPKKLSRILGAHLLFLGIGALLFVGKAMVWGGLYDPAIANPRLITTQNQSESHRFETDGRGFLHVGGNLRPQPLMNGEQRL
ncbi:MAG: hypothetical protein ACOCZG_01945 [Halothece sp.]